MSPDYVYLRDGSVLGRIIDFDDEGVPILDTTDRNPADSTGGAPTRPLSSPSQGAASRLWAKVDVTGGPGACWPWTGAAVGKGYGHISVLGRGMVTAHRLALELTIGRELNPGEFALHSCDHPICCNPAHLRPGTPQDNVLDMLARDRQPAHMRRRSHCRRGHQLTPDNTLLYAHGERRCRTCRQTRNNVRASRLADHEPDRYYGSGSEDDRPSEAPVGELVVPPTRLEGVSGPAAAPDAAVGPVLQTSVAPRD